MNILLDTHILIWLLTDDEKMPQKAREIICDSNNSVYYSTVNVWETEIKRQVKPKDFCFSGTDIEQFCAVSNLKCLPIYPKHALLLSSLKYSDTAPRMHKDPFDRILICQAKSENMKLLTHDTLIPFYDEDCVISV